MSLVSPDLKVTITMILCSITTVKQYYYGLTLAINPTSNNYNRSRVYTETRTELVLKRPNLDELDEASRV